jgi:hypothetical protein
MAALAAAIAANVNREADSASMSLMAAERGPHARVGMRLRKSDTDAMSTTGTRPTAYIAGLLAILALATPAAAQTQSAASTAGLEDPQWSVLSDSFGTTVDYPGNIFSVDAGAPPRGTGRTLRSPDDRAWLMMYVEGNDERHTPASFVSAYFAGPRDSLDYNRVTDRFFAISGVNDEQIFYSRCNFPVGIRGPMHCIYLAYPKDEERRWDAIVTRISRSLRPSGSAR